jgi:hypothetical protein
LFLHRNDYGDFTVLAVSRRILIDRRQSDRENPGHSVSGVASFQQRIDCRNPVLATHDNCQCRPASER